MKRVLITFGGSAYDKTTQETVNRALFLGVDKVLVYDDVWLRQHEFYSTNRWLFDLPGVKGLCWFAFKPLVIMDALERCEPGEIVCYIDGDTYPIADLTPLYDRCAADGGQMLFAAQGCSNRQWVKSDCWDVMAANRDLLFSQQDSTPNLWPGRRDVPIDSQHAVARFMLFQQGHWHVRQFLMEWLTYCLNPLATTFDLSILHQDCYDCHGEGEARPEDPVFEQHRTEQAILSLLAHKYSFKLYREADAFGNNELEKHGTDSWYPQCFVQEFGSGPRTNAGSRFRNTL